MHRYCSPRNVLSSLLYIVVIALIWNLQQKFQWILSPSSSVIQEWNGEERFVSSVATSLPRLLYIVTSLREYDNGRRNTIAGYDRFTNILQRVVVTSAMSMAQSYQVTLVLVTHYTLTEARHKQLRRALPSHIQFEYWDDATPIGYDPDQSKTLLVNVTRGLARQHRYIIKDRFLDFDAFVNMEDDIVCKREHVQQYTDLTQRLYQQRATAPTASFYRHRTVEDMLQSYSGNLTQTQLARLIPGLIRVEVIPEDDPNLVLLRQRARDDTSMVPSTKLETLIDANPCCNDIFQDGRKVESNAFYYWELSLDALGVRYLPDIGWVVLLTGNEETVYPIPGAVIGDYWSGNDYEFENDWKRDNLWYEGSKRPPRNFAQSISNQGGWMATRRQIYEWHAHRCVGSFLPPYDKFFEGDGLNRKNVEFWSGGLQIVGLRGCNMQRFVRLDADSFGKSLLYHYSNNKHLSPKVSKWFSQNNINFLLGQLLTVKKNAQDNLGDTERRIDD